MTQSGWSDPAGSVLVAVFAAPQRDGTDRVAVAMNQSSAETEIRLPEPRSGMAWRAVVDTHDPEAPERRLALADRARLQPRSSLILSEARTASGSGAPGAETIDTLAGAAGIELPFDNPALAKTRTALAAEWGKKAIAIGEGRGIALLCAARAGAEVFEYPPATVKRAIAGYGAAEKSQVAAWIGAWT